MRRMPLVLCLAAFSMACEGPAGPAGPSGPAGADGVDGQDGQQGAQGVSGSDGANGSDGMSGSDGKDGTNALASGDAGNPEAGISAIDGGKADSGASDAESEDTGSTSGGFRYDCKWCTPQPSSYAQCSPDQSALQRCVDDGDGCGHWELVEECDNGCGYDRTDDIDALGNRPLGEYICRPVATCLSTLICPSEQACDVYGLHCVASNNWLVATATLSTGFDGQTHQFSAAGEGLSASCSDAGDDYWDTNVGTGCSLSVVAINWTESSAGSVYSGHPITSVYFNVSSLSASGAQVVSCSGAGIDASRFTRRANTCTLTVTGSDLRSGGYVAGMFSRTDFVTGHGESADASSLSFQGSFRVAIP